MSKNPTMTQKKTNTTLQTDLNIFSHSSGDMKSHFESEIQIRPEVNNNNNKKIVD